MKAVADATPLIYLGRLGLLDELARFYDRVLVAPAVHGEVVSLGKELGRADALAVERGLAGDILILAPKPTMPKEVPTRLGRGERESIALATAESCELIVDDGEAYAIAEALGLKAKRTTALLLEGVQRGFWSAQRFEEFLVRLSREGFYLSADVYRYLLTKARELEHQES